MKHLVTMFVVALLAVAAVGSAVAQEEAHYEGYVQNSLTFVPGMQLAGRGLVTALYAPLISNFTNNEYTFVIGGLISGNPVVNGTTTYITYSAGNGSYIRIYEDPSQDARGTFYNCPSDILGPDPRYTDGVPYLAGHFVSYTTTWDASTGQGTFQATLNWDSGAHLNDLTPDKRGGWTFGGTTNNVYSCIPTPYYDQAITGRVFQVTTAVKASTWGQLRRLYN